MSLATRCPACGTIFRVVQDQLRVSEGWVRCGQCQQVFHGIEALFDLDNDPVVAARRAATQSAAMPPPTHVFAEQRTNAAAAEPTSRHAEPAISSAIGPADTSFAPTSIEPPRDMLAPIARATMAPRFAARLAEDAARAPGTALPPVAAPSPLAGAPSWQGLVLDTPQPFGTQSFAPRPEPIVPDPAEPAADQASAPGQEWQAPHQAAEPPAPVFAPPAAGDAPPTPPAPVFSAAAAPEIADDPDAGGSTVPSLLAQDDDSGEARAGPPTLASMLPQHAGQWPPRRRARRASAAAAAAGTELAIVDRRKDPRFLREAGKGARWRRPWVRAVLGAALLLLVVAAAGQAAWPQRDMLAARWPDTLPAWNWLCEQAGCRIAAPRSLASLSLDGSSLTRTDTEHVLLFSADLHNRSEHPVAVPSFDVTFMDLNGVIVARKVLTPAQIGIRQGSLPAEGELHVHARLQVGTLAANGFQADLFYP